MFYREWSSGWIIRASPIGAASFFLHFHDYTVDCNNKALYVFWITRCSTSLLIYSDSKPSLRTYCTCGTHAVFSFIMQIKQCACCRGTDQEMWQNQMLFKETCKQEKCISQSHNWNNLTLEILLGLYLVLWEYVIYPSSTRAFSKATSAYHQMLLSNTLTPVARIRLIGSCWKSNVASMTKRVCSFK